MLQDFGRFWQVSPRPKADLDLIGYVIERLKSQPKTDVDEELVTR